MARILCVSHCFPEPDTTSADRRFGAILELLSARHQVDLYCTGDKKWDVERRYLDQCACIGVRTFFGTTDEIDRVLLRRIYDAVIVEWWSTASIVAWAVRHRQPWARLIVDAVDVQFAKEESALALGLRDPATVAYNRRRELATYREADAVIVITDEDQAVLGACGIVKPSFLVPNVLRVRDRPPLSREREILFVGSSEHPPNVDAQVWFADHVWRAVRTEAPEARLTLIGSHPAPEVCALAERPGIEVLGFVPDTAPYLDRAAVSVAPLRWGGGMKGKVCEAMASGLPVVTTSFGAQGLNATPGEHLILADEPDAFARGVVGLLRDEAGAERMGRRGQELIRALCSPEIVARQLDALMEWVSSAPGSPRRLTSWYASSVGYHSRRLARSLAPVQVSAVPRAGNP